MSVSNKKHTLDHFAAHKGEMMIIDRKVLQFIGIGSDEWDYLYILYDGRKVSYHTILEPLVPIKNKIDDKDYNEIVRIAKLNWFSSEGIWNTSGEQKPEILNAVNKFKKEQSEKIAEQCDLMAEIFWDFV